MKINKIIETAIYCDDVAEMVNFYKTVLGLELLRESSERSAFFSCGESVLVIFNRSSSVGEGRFAPSHGAVGAGHIALEVDNGTLENWKKIFEENSIAIEKEISWEHSEAKSIYFRDPANNSIELAEKKLWNI